MTKGAFCYTHVTKGT